MSDAWRGAEKARQLRSNLPAGKADLTDRALVGWPILLILLLFNMLVSAYSGRVGWLLFWAIAFSSCVHEHGYDWKN